VLKPLLMRRSISRTGFEENEPAECSSNRYGLVSWNETQLTVPFEAS
jgi:hypothetical protein